jgi:hypothetical protein
MRQSVGEPGKLFRRTNTARLHFCVGAVALTLLDGTTLHATDGHPLYNPGTRTFTNAIHYRPGDTVQTTDGTATFITTTRTYTATLTAYNLHINTIHTYYAGTTPVLVHNSCDDFIDLPASAPRLAGLGSTGRVQPAGLVEQLAMTAVRAAPRGRPIPGLVLKDSRWPAGDGWVKMQQIENGVNVHYVLNTKTGAVDDFKFV